MLNKFFTFCVLAGFAGLFWVINIEAQDDTIQKFSYSFIAIACSYLFFSLILEEIITKRISQSKARYSFRKTTQLLFVAASAVVVLRIWIVNPQALLVAYGLVGAGVAIALQDVFKNFAGTIAILTTSIYRVGDRIEIGEKYGDVIDIGLFYSSLLEIRSWVDGDQTTGRITTIPNGMVLGQPLNNYTKDHSFIWDEISLPITYQSNWKKAVEIIEALVASHTNKDTERAEKEILRLEQKYYLTRRNIVPKVFIKPTDNWIMLSIRYVVDVRDRRLVSNKISSDVLARIEQENDITIASQTLTVTTVAR